MRNLLKQPYKVNWGEKNGIYSILVFSLFIFLFLWLFRPFGLSALKESHQFFVSMGFGAITGFMLFVFKYIIEPVVVGPRWTLGKNIMWDFVITSCIGAANYVYICQIFQTEFTFRYLIYSIWTAILVGSIPVTITYIVTYNRKYRDALKKADIPEEKITWTEEVVLTAGNEKNNITIDARQILYICSNDNYITIVTSDKGFIHKTTIRGTLKSVEHELKNHKNFVRCHKCYIANLSYVDKVSGNSQNLKIKLLHSDENIPVSRSKAGLFSSK